MKKAYKGRCHCGNVRFEFMSEDITEGRRCNCSLCTRRGIILSVSYILPQEFKVTTDPSLYSVYLWNDRVGDNVFCKTCGIQTFFGSAEYGYRINLGCVEGIDAFALPIQSIDGRSMPIADDPGPHPGEL
jgi:hypothetical protein